MSQVFCCIYVLLKALLENSNNDVPEVKLQKKDYKEKQAGSENNILDWHPVSLPISPRLLPSLTKGNSLCLCIPCTECSGSIIRVSEGWLSYYPYCFSHTTGQPGNLGNYPMMMPSSAEMWFCVLCEVKYLSTRNGASRLSLLFA